MADHNLEVLTMSEEYMFDNQSLVLAYDDFDNFIGVFVTYPGETFSKAELLDFFQNEARYMVVANAPLSENSGFLREPNSSGLAKQIQEFIERAANEGLEDDEIVCYIPKYLH